MSDPRTNTSGTFIEVGHDQICKYNQLAEGDRFLSSKNPSDGRVITVLSDGLGSGIKAGVLATLTATMAIKFVANDIPIRRAAKIIMDTLPVCSDRGISYATFTLVDIEPNAAIRIMEYDNPPYLLIRQNTIIEPIKQSSQIERENKEAAPYREAVLYYSEYQAHPGDRLIFYSDGVTQSGMGSRIFPLGWGSPQCQEFILDQVKKKPLISASDLAHAVVHESEAHDGFKAKDDITCCVIYFRTPRDTLIVTGPPLNPERDSEYARFFDTFEGKRIVCGGTTANIISRQLNRKVHVNLKNIDPIVPPYSEMEGADIVTEGIITMGKVAEILDSDDEKKQLTENAATKIVDLLRDSDRITFAVGTKINEAHQDPNMPVELEIRRNVVKRISNLLEQKYLKEVHTIYF